MTEKQKQQFNQMLKTLRTIAKSYAKVGKQMEREAKSVGCDYEECLEYAYENIQNSAASAIKGVKEIKD